MFSLLVSNCLSVDQVYLPHSVYMIGCVSFTARRLVVWRNCPMLHILWVQSFWVKKNYTKPQCVFSAIILVPLLMGKAHRSWRRSDQTMLWKIDKTIESWEKTRSDVFVNQCRVVSRWCNCSTSPSAAQYVIRYVSFTLADLLSEGFNVYRMCILVLSVVFYYTKSHLMWLCYPSGIAVGGKSTPQLTQSSSS